MEKVNEIDIRQVKPDSQPMGMLDASKVKREFGFEARTSFRNGLGKTIEWYKEHGKN